MSSPVGHSLMGYCIYLLAARRGTEQNRPSPGFCVLASNAADLDLLPGLLMGSPLIYHKDGISHSLVFALVFALACSGLLARCQHGRLQRRFCLYGALYGSHIMLDYLGAGREIPFFWPIDSTPYTAAFGFLPRFDMAYHAPSLEFLISLFSLRNLWVVGIEILALLPGIILIKIWNIRFRESS